MSNVQASQCMKTFFIAKETLIFPPETVWKEFHPVYLGIADGIFEEARSLYKLQFPASVVIGSFAFYSCAAMSLCFQQGFGKVFLQPMNFRV